MSIVNCRLTINIGGTGRVDAKESQRLADLSRYEEKLYSLGCEYIAGIDEAGRGPLAGPVVAAAVILKRNEFIEGVDDSKKLTPRKRERLFEDIIKNCVCYSVGIADQKCIDEINILNATQKAMYMAVSGLNPRPGHILIDALRLDELDIPQTAIINGDARSISIAAASIIAKVTRDRIIEEYGKEYPQYGFENHKGYGTKEHISAIKKYGLCPIHRLSFTKKFIEV